MAFYSRKLGPAEQRYEIYDKELLAIVACLLEWRVYLEGAQPPTQVITDHLNLTHFMTARSLNGRQARWAVKLGAYDFRIVYRPGRENSKADLLSRRDVTNRQRTTQEYTTKEEIKNHDHRDGSYRLYS